MRSVSTIQTRKSPKIGGSSWISNSTSGELKPQPIRPFLSECICLPINTVADIPPSNYSLFHGIYKDDIARFGNPAESSESVVEASAIPRWQVVLQAHAKDIAGGKTSAKGKKRKATALEDDG